MDLLALRTEIKSWERAFRTEHQRNPTLDDIKALPKIVAKYKLYKKLSKEAIAVPVKNGASDDPPSTPPRRSFALPGPSSLLPKSRPASHAIPDATPNPFSPSKSSQKRISNSEEPPLPKLDFFKQPSTPPRKKQASASSPPETFPPVNAISEATPPFVTSAVKKARKRLRGDLVSPSPKKPRIVQPSSEAQPDSNEDEPGTAFVDESPVKANLSNGKDFKLLFEEGKLSQPDFSLKRGPFSHAKSTSDTFGNQRQSLSASKRETVKLKPSQGQAGRLASQKSKPSSRSVKSTPYEAVKSNLRDNFPVTETSATEDVSQPPSRKRSSSVGPDNSAEKKSSFSAENNGLLPPSPPASPGHSGTREASSKGSNRNRKKAKLIVANEFNEDSTDEDHDLQVVEIDSHSLRRNMRSSESDEDEADLKTFGFTNKDVSDKDQEIRDDTFDAVEPEISLPENLRNMLHISSSRRDAHEEKALVESLLQGRPSPRDARGEVWSIGEVEDATATTTDEEWAGEGVPWEAAEL